VEIVFAVHRLLVEIYTQDAPWVVGGVFVVKWTKACTISIILAGIEILCGRVIPKTFGGCLILLLDLIKILPIGLFGVFVVVFLLTWAARQKPFVRKTWNCE
jgi:hypothetical protein